MILSKNILEKECISTLTEVPWTGDEESKGESDYQKGIPEPQRPFAGPSFISTRDELRVSKGGQSAQPLFQAGNTGAQHTFQDSMLRIVTAHWPEKKVFP